MPVLLPYFENAVERRLGGAARILKAASRELKSTLEQGTE
jgi:hypothetical protein